MENEIRLEYIVGKRKYVSKIKREDFINNMEYLKDAFPSNNEIAIKLLSILPEIVAIRINQNINDDQYIPGIWCETMDGNILIKIHRYHSIIWGFLNHYCYEAMK